MASRSRNVLQSLSSGRGSFRGRALSLGSFFLDIAFSFLKGRPEMRRDCPAADFDGHAWIDALEQGYEHDTKHVVVGVLLVGNLGHVRGQRADQSVAQ